MSNHALGLRQNERTNGRREGCRHCQSLMMTRTKIRPTDDADVAASAPDHLTFPGNGEERRMEKENKKSEHSQWKG